MRRRLQLTDTKNQLLTITININFVGQDGVWMPDAPGYIQANTKEVQNEFKAWSDQNKTVMFGYLYAGCSDGQFIRVLRLDNLSNMYAGAVTSPSWNDAGSGTLYSEGAMTLAAGDVKWKLL